MRGFLTALWLMAQLVWLQAAGYLAWVCLGAGLAGVLPGLLFLALFGLIGRRMYQVAAGRVELEERSLSTQALGSIALQMLLGGLLAVALPGFRDLSRVSASGEYKRLLAEVRHALNTFQNAKGPPASLEALVAAGALPALPELRRHRELRPHPATRQSVVLAPGAATDSGRWGYSVGPSSASVFIDCTHTDLKDVEWRSY